MNIGSLYKVKKSFWLLFPTKEIAAYAALGATAATSAVDGASPDAAQRAAAWYSKRFNCEVTDFPLDSIVVCLEEDGKFKKLLTADGLVGWTWFDESCNDCFEEVKTQ